MTNDSQLPKGLPAWARGSAPRHGRDDLLLLPSTRQSIFEGRAMIQIGTGSGKTHAFLATYDHWLREDQATSLVLIDETHHLVIRDGNTRSAAGFRQLMQPASVPQPTDPPKLVALPFQPRRLRVLSDAELYAKWMRQAEEWERTGRDQRRVESTTDHRVRNPLVTKAVLKRSKGRCENPRCRNREPVGYTDSGDPILEVDHVVEHAKGGRDHGSNTIALCPNCHALKTRGRDRHELGAFLRGVAQHLDQDPFPHNQ
ncbi:HNH endonuclease [Streptomyces prunicolor]|uniref:HNH endonuclease n=1 Tax=Streptomyces prunicolor TaxID=67348 RepID=UPI0022505704|nr:HNH endonuclease [Streptomyces prunicolor]MCX5235624.1 HNH endonuclease [Streptomyces prunicolor]